MSPRMGYCFRDNIGYEIQSKTVLEPAWNRKTSEVVMAVMEIDVERMDILKRLLVTIVCLLVFELVRILVQATVLFQFLYMLIARKQSEPLRKFSNRLSWFVYKLLRYSTLNENGKPFPFSEFPKAGDCDRPSNTITFE